MSVTVELRNVCRGVTRLSPSCYAEILEYIHHANKAWDIRYARFSLQKERAADKRSPLITLQEVPWRAHYWRIR